MNGSPEKPTAAIPDEIHSRPESPEDEAFLLSVYASTREEELNATGWNEAARLAFVRMQFQAQRQGYRGMFPEGEFTIIMAGGQTAGRMVVNQTTEEIRLVDIALLPAFQNRGIGGQLVNGLIAEAQKLGKPLRVSVFKGNRATRFYHRLGFVQTGEAGLYDLWEWSRMSAPEQLVHPVKNGLVVESAGSLADRHDE